MDFEQMIALAADMGFAAAAITETKDIVFDPSFRPYCEENLCGKYGVNYACPPDCGTVEEMKQRILAHSHALVLQTIWDISDIGDGKATKAAKGRHNAATIKLTKKLRALGVPGFPVGAGGCSMCNPCAITMGEPCRSPDLQFSCMSAFCIFVKKLADHCGLEYDCGPGLIAFFGLFVFDA
ncbi:MAG: DUF2284 domain-containing protein [Clostridia bacterium]|nr:DUF2284 domain-containing protein [Clostridia bacterium]